MILVGIEYANSAIGFRDINKTCIKCKDIHEAAKEIRMTTWSNGWQVNTFQNGEFHDIETHKTWSVDECGHTKKDYRIESETMFKERWREVEM